MAGTESCRILHPSLSRRDGQVVAHSRLPLRGQPFLPITPDPARLGTYRSPCSKFSVRRTRPTSLQPPFGRGIPFSQPGRFLLTAVEQPKSTCPGSPQPSPGSRGSEPFWTNMTGCPNLVDAPTPHVPCPFPPLLISRTCERCLLHQPKSGQIPSFTEAFSDQSSLKCPPGPVIFLCDSRLTVLRTILCESFFSFITSARL